jgi:hypothetical protein
MMKNVKSKSSQALLRVAIAIVALGMAAVPAVHAKPNSKKGRG